ncbi:hypothetical protein AAC387_Pa08g0347 [Persea americana]
MTSLLSTFTLQYLTRLTLTTTPPAFRHRTASKAHDALRAMSSAPPHRLFQLRLDPLTGNSEWVVLEEDEDPQNPTKALLSSTSYLDMLNDSRRNTAFHEAIKKTLTRPCHVLDIGAGTGLLSMMAAKAMDSTHTMENNGGEGMVSACESYLPMFKLMRKIIRANCMERKIRVFCKRSDELKVSLDLPSRADILVSEILDSELLGEGLIPTLQHAHDELLVANPQTVPYRATIYGQLVECTYLRKLHDLHGSEAHASDCVLLTPSGLETAICVKVQQHAMHCDALSAETKLLSEPFKIFEFDFWKRPDSRGETELQVKATSDGIVHAVVSWWVLQLDCDGAIFYSTAPKWISSPLTEAPGLVDWCDHWKQCVWFIPGMGMPLSRDEQVSLEALHSETSVSYNLRTANPRLEVDPRLYNSGHHLILLPERIAIYGDREWRIAMLKAARSALEGKSSPLCIIADDSVFLTILIARLTSSTSSHVISMFPGLCEKGHLYLQAVADANGFSMDRVEVIRRKTCLTLDDTNQRKVDLLVGEPFYHGNEGMLPWQNLRFWKERTKLDSVLSEDALIMPCKGILKACAMSLPDLWKSRNCLSGIEGFDHSVVNETFGACGDLPELKEGPCLPYFIWQCGESKELSEVFTVMEFNFQEHIRTCYGKTKIGFTKPGVCHGFALWIDWVMDAKNSIVVSTGPDSRYWKQGVKLLSKPVPVGPLGSCDLGESCLVDINASFDSSAGELIIDSTFSSL